MTFNLQKLLGKNYNFGSILHNQIFLYIVFIISMINVVVNALQKDPLIPTLFILIAFIVSFFSKNMTVILLVALCASNIIKYGTKIRVSEGMEPLLEEEETSVEESDTLKKSVSQSKPKDILKASEPLPMGGTSELDPSGIKLAKSTMIDLLSIQKAITTNVQSIEKSITNAEVVVNRMKEGLEPLLIKKIK